MRLVKLSMTMCIPVRAGQCQRLFLAYWYTRWSRWSPRKYAATYLHERGERK
jgi:hypothetical protein